MAYQSMNTNIPRVNFTTDYNMAISAILKLLKEGGKELVKKEDVSKELSRLDFYQFLESIREKKPGFYWDN